MSYFRFVVLCFVTLTDINLIREGEMYFIFKYINTSNDFIASRVFLCADQ